MKKHIKKVICLALVTIMTLAYAPAKAKAGKLTNYRGIDLTPLNLYYGHRDVALTIGTGFDKLVFRGELRTITKSQLEGICAQTVKDLNTTVDKILESQKAMRNFDELATKLDGRGYGDGALKAAIVAAAGALPGAAGVVGTVGGTVLDIKDSDGGWTSTAESIGWGGAGVAAGAFAGPLGSLMVSLAQFGWSRLELWQMKEELELSYFEGETYRACLDLIRRKIENQKKLGMLSREIVFNESKQMRGFTFYGVGGNFSNWTFSMTLDQRIELDGMQGVYAGDFRMFVTYGMYGFLTSPRDAANNNAGGAFDASEQTGNELFRIKYSNYFNPSLGGVAEIERTITGTATAVVDEKGNIDFKFEQSDDLRATNIANLGYMFDMSTSAPEIGEFWRVSANFAFESNYSGPDNPPMRVVGQGEPEYWVHPIYYEFEMTEAGRVAAENQLRNQQVEITFDENAWVPWVTPNPSARLEIGQFYTR